MCNLYRMTRSIDEIANLFEVAPERGANFGAEVYPGYPGVVVFEGKARTMSWGFPLVLKGKRGQPLKPKPVNNTREDKLASGFWKASFEQRRCLIPVSAWAEAEGKKGAMTRTWYALPGDEPFAVAGVWRPTEEWGDAYSMVMVDGSAQMADVHDRMPVILTAQNWPLWTGGAPETARDLCRTWDGELLVDRTDTPWSARRTKKEQPRLV